MTKEEIIEENNNSGSKSDKSSTLTDRQQIIMEAMIMQRTTQQTLEYLKDNGFPISERTLRREKQVINDKNVKRLYQIAKIGFHKQHLERIEKLKYIERCMWDDARDCTDPYKRTKIKEMIANLQPIMASFIDVTRYVIEKAYPTRNLDSDPNYHSYNKQQ